MGRKSAGGEEAKEKKDEREEDEGRGVEGGEWRGRREERSTYFFPAS